MCAHVESCLKHCTQKWEPLFCKSDVKRKKSRVRGRFGDIKLSYPGGLQPSDTATLQAYEKLLKLL